MVTSLTALYCCLLTRAGGWASCLANLILGLLRKKREEREITHRLILTWSSRLFSHSQTFRGLHTHSRSNISRGFVSIFMCSLLSLLIVWWRFCTVSVKKGSWEPDLSVAWPLEFLNCERCIFLNTSSYHCNYFLKPEKEINLFLMRVYCTLSWYKGMLNIKVIKPLNISKTSKRD